MSKTPETDTFEALLKQEVGASVSGWYSEKDAPEVFAKLLSAHTTEVKRLQWLINQQKKEQERLIVERQTALEAAKREADIDFVQRLGRLTEAAYGPKCLEYDRNCPACAAWIVSDDIVVMLETQRDKALSHPNQPKQGGGGDDTR